MQQCVEYGDGDTIVLLVLLRQDRNHCLREEEGQDKK